MPSDDRDQQLDRALARHLRNASPDAACPDAEILAAYHERSLSLEEMAHWKTHIASCSRCQETLALLEQTDSVAANDWEKGEVPAALQASRARSESKDTEKEESALAMRAASAAPAPVEIRSAPKAAVKMRRRVPWSILAPTAALAAGLLVWVAVHDRTNLSVQKAVSVQVAENREASPPALSAAPQSGKAEARDEGSYNLQPGIRADHKTSPALTSPALHAEAPLPTYSAAPQSAPKESLDSELDRLRQPEASKPAVSPGAGATSGAVTAKRAVAAAPPAPSAAARSAGGPLVANQMQNQMQNQAVNQYSNQAAAPPANQAASGGANQAADRAKVRAETQAAGQDKKEAQAELKQKNEAVAVGAATETVEVTSAESSVAKGKLSGLATNGRDFSSLMLVNSGFIAAPDNKHVWHVGPAGKIERSSDAGTTWKAQKSGVTADLFTGSAPSEKVCWIAGKAGTLLRTTDAGKHWKQLSSPIADDIGGVNAVNAQDASIWDLPNHKRFETSDGGLTWKLLANR